MKIKSLIQIMMGVLLFFIACKDETTFQGNHDPEVIKNYRNSATPALKKDSLASVNFITKQKLTELYELSSLYSANSKDSLMRDILFPQIQSYFYNQDSIQISKLLKEMDSLKVYFVEIRKMNLPEKDSLIPDSVRIVKYNVRYYNQDKRLIDSLPKMAKYILKQEPKQFKKEFIFYFTDLNSAQLPKDSIPSGLTQ